MRIGVIGGGKWGEALRFALSQKCDAFITSRHTKKIKNFITLDEIFEFEYLVIALPAQITKEWLRDHFVYKDQKVLVASKGIDATTGEFLDEIYKSFIPQSSLAFLSGPSFASEVIKSLPTAVMVNSTNLDLAKKFCSFFPDFIKTYISDDVTGAEIAGAYKNVIAIASGICDGLELGNNARASLLARGLVEMTRFGKFFGANEETFLGLSGAGDLFLTASSKLSRNYRVGNALAKGKNLSQILEELKEVAEGVYTSKAINYLSLKHGIYTPIADEVEKIINGKDPKQSLRDLLR